MACDEAELGEEKFEEKTRNQQKLQEQVKFSSNDKLFGTCVCVQCILLI